MVRAGRAELAAVVRAPPVVLGLALGQEGPQMPLAEDEHLVGDFPSER